MLLMIQTFLFIKFLIGFAELSQKTVIKEKRF